MKKVALIVLVITLLFAGFGVRFRSERFEDGSGTVTIVYCVPLAPCTD